MYDSRGEGEDRLFEWMKSFKKEENMDLEDRAAEAGVVQCLSGVVLLPVQAFIVIPESVGASGTDKWLPLFTSSNNLDDC